MSSYYKNQFIQKYINNKPTVYENYAKVYGIKLYFNCKNTEEFFDNLFANEPISLDAIAIIYDELIGDLRINCHTEILCDINTKINAKSIKSKYDILRNYKYFRTNCLYISIDDYYLLRDNNVILPDIKILCINYHASIDVSDVFPNLKITAGFFAANNDNIVCEFYDNICQINDCNLRLFDYQLFGDVDYYADTIKITMHENWKHSLRKIVFSI